MEEAAELIDLGSYNDVRACVLSQVFLMTLHLLLQTLARLAQITDLVSELKDSKELVLLG